MGKRGWGGGGKAAIVLETYSPHYGNSTLFLLSTPLLGVQATALYTQHSEKHSLLTRNSEHRYLVCKLRNFALLSQLSTLLRTPDRATALFPPTSPSSSSLSTQHFALKQPRAIAAVEIK
ncbi:hypothetical protein QM565_08005 [Geitlerinema splendidum]|nr:hypothetical protein [Geitlerinema splendidum]